MKKSLKINSQGDLEFNEENGDLKMIEGTEEIVQRVKISISINETEWPFNLNLGVPYIQLMKRKAPNEDFKSEIRAELNKDDRIVEIEEINIERDREKRILYINFRVRLENGELIEESVVI